MNSPFSPKRREVEEPEDAMTNPTLDKPPVTSDSSSSENDEVKTRILWPEVEGFIPNPPNAYVDIHGILDNSLSLALPAAWIEDPDATDVPPSSNLLYNSPHGFGKSVLAASFAVEAAKGLGYAVPMITVECNADVREHHLRGGLQIDPNGGTFFVPGPFLQAIYLANQVGCCVLNLEEISALTPGAQKMVNSMTDWRTGMFVPQLGYHVALRPGARVLVVATMNPKSYGGVYKLNDDLRSRFDEFVVPYPSEKAERKILFSVCSGIYDSANDEHRKLIKQSCQLAAELRGDNYDYLLSTRDLRHLIENVHKLGGDLKVPLRFILAKYTGNQRESVLDRVEAVFGKRVLEETS